MKQLLITLAIVAVTAGSTLASDSTDVMTTVQKFVDGFNKGDTALIAATHADEVFIIDEFPPYLWQGKRALLSWINDFNAFCKKDSVTGAAVTLDKSKHVTIAGEYAYVVTAANIAMKVKGQPAGETGSTFALALRRSPAGWRITGWSWAAN